MNKFKNIIISAVFTIGVIFVICGFYFENNIPPIYTYTAHKENNYSVLLNKNKFYETETLEPGKAYAALSIKSYNINFKYNFEGSKNANIKYNYNITANLVGTVENNEGQIKEIWSRNYILKDMDKKELNSTKKLEINESANINYAYYNDLARSFEKQYKISVNTILKVRFNIYSEIDILEKEKFEDYIEIDIPITSTISEVRQNYEEDTKNEIYSQNNTNEIYKISLFIIGGSLILISVVYVLIKEFKRTPEEIYKRKIKRIFKYYKDLIVTVKKEPNIEGLKVMEVSNLEDLIDVAEQTQSNMIYFENQNKTISTFYVIANDYVYVFKILLQHFY